MIKNLNRSICSTCRYLSTCVLTTDKSNISSCSEYVHRLDREYPILAAEPIRMFSSSGQKKENELVFKSNQW